MFMVLSSWQSHCESSPGGPIPLTGEWAPPVRRFLSNYFDLLLKLKVETAWVRPVLCGTGLFIALD